MLFMIEVINNFQQIFVVKILTISCNESEKFDLINRLIKVVFIILNDFHANHLLGVNIIALNSL